jgi:hypothetical protein
MTATGSRQWVSDWVSPPSTLVDLLSLKVVAESKVEEAEDAQDRVRNGASGIMDAAGVGPWRSWERV